MSRIEACKVSPGENVNLCKFPTDDDGGLTKDTAEAELAKLRERLFELQALLYAERKHALLVVLQAMDTGGKDSTIRGIFSGMNPQGCRVTSFKAPHELERTHDFLWRVHAAVPPLGDIGIFNRSHYEDVLIVRVHDLVPEKRLKSRYDHINAFEEMLHDEGVTIRKFFLHISKEYQKKRLQRRLDNPKKRWKFNPDDLTERARWDDYQRAYEEALTRCSTKHAPWYVIPAENRSYRDLLISRALVEALESMNMQYPEPAFDPDKVRID